MLYLNSIIIFIAGIGAGIGTFFLARFVNRLIKEKRTAKAIILSLAALLAGLLTLILIISGFGWLIIALR